MSDVDSEIQFKPIIEKKYTRYLTFVLVMKTPPLNCLCRPQVIKNCTHNKCLVRYFKDYAAKLRYAVNTHRHQAFLHIRAKCILRSRINIILHALTPRDSVQWYHQIHVNFSLSTNNKAFSMLKNCLDSATGCTLVANWSFRPMDDSQIRIFAKHYHWSMGFLLCCPCCHWLLCW